MPVLEQAPPATHPEHERHDDGDLSTIQERHPDWPKLKVNFYFASHVYNLDMEGIEPHLKEADILLYEDFGRDKSLEQFYNQHVTKARQSLPEIIDKTTIGDNLLAGTSREPLVRGLYNSRKVAASIDVGNDAEETEYFLEISKLLHSGIPRDTDYETALKTIRETYARLAELQDEREEKMVGNFEPEIADILDKRPDLKEKTELNILISMGSYHTRLQHAFTKHGLKSDRNFPVKPYKYSYRTELERSLAFGIEPSTDLLQRALMEGISSDISITLKERISSDNLSLMIRELVSKLDDKEMRGMYDKWQKYLLTPNELNRQFSAHGLQPAPWSNKDILEQITPNKRKRKMAKKVLNFQMRIPGRNK